MALWGTHFAIGSLGALLVIQLLRPDTRGQWLIVFLSGLWAIVPDAHWVYPPLWDVTKPVIHDSSVSNLFWFHGWIDGSLLDTWDTFQRPYPSVLLTVLFVVVYLATTGRKDG